MRTQRWHRLTAAGITKTVLPVMVGGAALRLVAAMSKSEDPAVRDISLSLVASAAAMSTLPPKSLKTFENLLGDANYGRFLSQCGTVTAAGVGTAVMVRSALGTAATPKVRAQRRRMLSTLALMGTLFVRDRSTAAELQAPSDRLYVAPITAYWLLFAGYMVQSTAETARLAAATSRQAQDPFLRTGLRAVAAGTGVLGTFYGQLALGTLGRLSTRKLPGPVRGVPAQAVIGGCAATAAFGAALPGAAWRLRALRRATADTVTWLRLRPLWRYVEGRNPEVTLAVGSVTRPDVRLFRRVVEILDGLDRLAAHRDPDGRAGAAARSVAATHGLSASEQTALERAALIQHARTSSAAPTLSLIGNTGSAAHRPGSDVHSDYRQEARRLIAARKMGRNTALLRPVLQALSTATGEDQHVAS